jgi:hypothetical protein
MLAMATLLLAAASASAETAQENPDIKLFLVNDDGGQSSVYTLNPSSDAVRDILFRTSIPANLSYSFWAFEISNPASKQTYRLALQGKVPPVLHWDGVFPDGGTIRPQQTYYIRLVLITAERKAISSPSQVVTTRQGTGTEYVQLERRKQTFYAFPVGAFYYTTLKTGSVSTSHFPIMHASLRLAFDERNSFGFIIETTPNILTSVSATPNGFFYSHVSIFYRYRLMGALPHPPILPLTPDYARGKADPPALPAQAFGAKTNLELGFRAYNNILRGFGGQQIDPLVSRQTTGLMASLLWDRRLGVFRMHGGLEAGYSVFKGGLFTANAQTGITYDRYEHLSPGIEARYQFSTGSGSDDPQDGVASGAPTGITNHIFMVGVSALFKI